MARNRRVITWRASRKGRFPPGKRPFLLGGTLLLLSLGACGGKGPPAPGRVDPRVDGLRLLAFLGGAEGLEESFFMDRFEVTQAQFSAYLAAVGKRPSPWLREVWKGRGGKGPSQAQEDWPVTMVSPSEALSYAKWRGMRLPRLDEWEWAVGIRGAKKESFPWGEEFDRAHWDELKCNTAELGLGRPADVGTFELGATRGTGIYDLIGNVAEWVRLPPGYPSRERGSGPGWEGGPTEALRLRFSLEATVWAFPMWVPSWWKGFFPNLAPLGTREWSMLRKSLAWMGSPAVTLNRRFSLEATVWAFPMWVPLWWRGLFSSAAPLGTKEWEVIRRPWAWVGWSYVSRMERVAHSIPGRVSSRKGWGEWATTVGFRCAASPGEILAWLLSKGGPSLEGATGRAVKRFLRRHRGVFTVLLGKGFLLDADPARKGRIASML